MEVGPPSWPYSHTIYESQEFEYSGCPILFTYRILRTRCIVFYVPLRLSAIVAFLLIRPLLRLRKDPAVVRMNLQLYECLCCRYYFIKWRAVVMFPFKEPFRTNHIRGEHNPRVLARFRHLKYHSESMLQHVAQHFNRE